MVKLFIAYPNIPPTNRQMIAVAIKAVVKRDTFGFSGNSNYYPPFLVAVSLQVR
jgi:hypothetical protein